MYLDLVNELILIESISEGVVSAKKRFVDTGKLGTTYFEELVKVDPTKNKKYIEWMCKMSTEVNIVYDRLTQIIRDFDRLASKGYLENTDIYKYKTLKEVEDILVLPKNKESLQKVKKERESEVEKVLDNEDFLVVFPRTSEAMKKYGKGTKWCVTNEAEWEDYTHNSYFKIYVVVNKKSLSFKTKFYPINSKFAVLVKIDKELALGALSSMEEAYLVVIYDDEDNVFSVFDKKEFLKFMGFNSEKEARDKLFKPFTKKELENLKS